MPEAAVDEDRHSRSGEQHVRPSPRQPRQWVVYPVPEPEAVELVTKEELGLGVPPGLPGHSSGGGGQHTNEGSDRRGAGARRGVGGRRTGLATLRLYVAHLAIMPGTLMPQALDRAIRTLDLFAGAGGLTTGLSLAPGLEVDAVCAVEFDLSAAATYTLNHGGRIEDGCVVGGAVYAGSIQDWLHEVEPAEVDLVVGGPPCQGFSTLGKQNVDDDRNFLWHRYAEAVKRSTPRYFVLENVPAFLTSPQWDVFQDELESGMLADYEIEVDILNAADYGAVQARKRVIVIGHHKDFPAPGLPTKTHEHQHRTLDEIFQDIPNTVDRIGLPEGTVTYGGVDRPGAFATRELHFGRFYTDLSLKRFASIPEKGNRFNLPDELLAPCWRKHRTGTADVMGRLHLDKPSVTIRTEFFKPEKGRYLHPTEDRAITHYEAALIQGFPEDYQWVGTREEIARQIGNAVPIPLGTAIGRQLQKAFSGRLEAPEESEASRAA